MSWKERMYAGIGEHLRSKGLDCIEVLKLDEGAEEDGCMTCGSFGTYSQWLSITFRNSRGETEEYEYEGNFADFINGITDAR